MKVGVGVGGLGRDIVKVGSASFDGVSRHTNTV